MKRRILTAGAVMLGVILLLVGVVCILEHIRDLNTVDETKGDDPIYFYTPDPDANILEDEDYLGLDRRIYVTRGGETTPVTDENVSSHGPAVQTLQTMIDSLIAGDNEAYNALFSRHYYATEGNEPKEAFTMQRVYGIELEIVRQVTQTDSQTGKIYTQYDVIVNYRIARNDGTFRRDIGSDESREQYYVLSDSTGDEVLIDQILNYNYQ